MLKNEWRKHLKTIRNKISPIRRKEASEIACETLKILTHEALFILSFASFGSEIDLWPLNQALADEGRLALPRMANRELHLYQVKNLSDLERHAWGLQEPIPSLSTLIEPSEITIALIPGLGFDPQAKTRLGYGKGYYDRLLARFKSTDAWGVGFHEQAIQGLPCEPHDKLLDKIYLF